MTPPPPPTTLTWSPRAARSDSDQVLEVLHVPALVGRHRDALDVLLERGVDHLLHGAVVAEVDHLAALALEDPPHDVDRGVVTVEQAEAVTRRTWCWGWCSSGMGSLGSSWTSY